MKNSNQNLPTTFSAYVCHDNTEQNPVKLEILPSQKVGQDQVLIRNAASSLTFPDLLMMQGKYQYRPDPPFTPGTECCGQVISVGEAVSRFQVGDWVIGTPRQGALAQQVLLSESACFPLPDYFTPIQGAAFLTAYKTAYVALKMRGRLATGETVLVLGAASGVGAAALDLAQALGARVIAAATGSEKCQQLRKRGIEHVVDISEGTLREQVKALTNNKGVELVFDPVGGEVFDQALRCLATPGRLLVVGFASGQIPTLAVNYVLIKQLEIIGVRAGEYCRANPEKALQIDQNLFELANSEKLNPWIHKVFKFNELEKALQDLKDRQVCGRAILEIR